MNEHLLSRRALLGTAGAAVLGIVPLKAARASAQAGRKPNSKVAGVQLGVTTYSYRSMPHRVDEVIEYLLFAGVNSIELRLVAEEDLGIPKDKAAQRQWRLSLPMERYDAMRKKFNAAGIDVHIAKFAPSTWSDEEIDYAYEATRRLGAIGITDELGDAACQRLGKFAEKHKSLAMFHTHGQVAEPGFSFDKYLAYSPANMLNLDAGHYYGATGLHPNDVIAKYPRSDAEHPHQGQDRAAARDPERQQAVRPGRDAHRRHPPAAQEGAVANPRGRGAGVRDPDGLGRRQGNEGLHRLHAERPGVDATPVHFRSRATV